MAKVSLFRGKLIACSVGRALPTIVSVAVGLSLGLLQASAQTSSLPGKSGVSGTGAATYSVPISVPPGTAGMSPSLSLDYNSQSGASSGWLGAGVAGVGWSLSGLPAIGRCPRTVAQDGANGAVNYDANDRFCLDGQRLIAVTGAYGADGAEYRTEVESFSRIISHGTAGTGPAWFEVRSKSGQILQFGNTTDSRILAQGKTTARSWGVNKVSDTKGNYFTVTYVNDTVNGQAYPSRIDYTANDAASLAAYNSVRFVYDTNRTDVLPVYHAGSLLKTTVRLTNVQTYSGSALVGDYRLAYQQGSATGRSQLTSLTLCDGSGNCLPATNFTWQNGTTTPTVISNVAGQNGTLAGSAPFLGDFNGDGLPDIMWDAATFAGPGSLWSAGTRVLWTNSGNGNFTVIGNFVGQNGALAYNAPIVADFNRDGRTDVWWYRVSDFLSPAVGGNITASIPFNQTTKWWSTTGSGVAVNTGATTPANNFLVGAMDINGDNRPDLLWYNSDPESLVLTTWLTNADGTVTESSFAAPPGVQPGTPRLTPGFSYARNADFNGDGRADLLWTSSSGGKLALWQGNSDGTFAQVSGADASVAGYNAIYIDINGDGKTDILWDRPDSYGRSAGQRILWISKGDGTFIVNTNPGGLNGTLVGHVATIGDFNSDGIADVFWVQADTSGLTTGARVGWLGKGDGTFTVIANYGGQDGTLVGYVPLLADFNGDGKTDILWDSRSGSDPRSSGTRVLWLSDGAPPDIVERVTNGAGAAVTFTYKSLTDSAVYTKDNTATDPIVDVQMPLQAVSRIDVSNGIGGTLATAYAYVGAKSDVNGRGFLGFRQMKTTDLQTNIVQTATYRQDYPFLFSVANETQTLASATLGATTNTYGSTSLGGTRYQVFLTQSQTTKSDLDGTAVPTATTTYQYDAYNNATQITVATSDGYSKTTNNTYTNDTTNWFLGRLTASTVTAQAPQQLGQYCSLPWGGTISNGQSVTAYSAATGPVGQACSAIAQTRTCTHGTLSGSYSQQSCAALCALPWGGTINQGQSVTAYSVASVPSPQTCSSVAETRSCAASGVLSGSYTKQSCSVIQPVRIYLTSGSSWTVPANWNNSVNSIEVIGGGAGGANGGSGDANWGGAGGGGGGGGAYSKISNVSLTPGSAIAIRIGNAGGAGGAGGDTWTNGTSCAGASVCAKGGNAGSGASSGAGGAAASGVGATKFSGGAGGSGVGVGPYATGGSAGGGGGAAGPNGAGNNGAAGSSGGGLSGGGTGGTGDAGNGGGGGAGPIAGTGGSGTGGNGGEFGSGLGSGGGGGAGYGGTPGGEGVSGGNGSAGGAAGSYGGGGGGGGAGGFDGGLGAGAGAAGGVGRQGIIIITYTPII